MATSIPDGDARDLLTRALRIAEDVHELGVEALRVRNQHRHEIDDLRKDYLERDIATVLGIGAMGCKCAPASVVAFFRLIVKNHPVASDDFDPLPGIKLGELRAWIKAIDG